MFKLRIETDNAAFGTNAYEAAGEISRILAELADRVKQAIIHDGDRFTLRDINGNKVGEAVYLGGLCECEESPNTYAIGKSIFCSVCDKLTPEQERGAFSHSETLASNDRQTPAKLEYSDQLTAYEIAKKVLDDGNLFKWVANELDLSDETLDALMAKLSAAGFRPVTLDDRE
jgi:hypothetical protein